MTKQFRLQHGIPALHRASLAGRRPAWKVDGENLTIDMTKDSGMKKYIEFQQKLIDEDLIDTKTANWSDDWNRELNDGTIASLTIGGWMPINLMNGAPDQAGNWRVAQLPQWRKAKRPPPRMVALRSPSSPSPSSRPPPTSSWNT